MSVYFSKYFDFKSFINSKYDVKLVFNKFGIPRIEFNDVFVLRKIADSYIWASRLLAISIPMVFAIIGHSIFKLGESYLLILPLLGTMLGLLFHLNDIKKLWKIGFGDRNSFYVKFMRDDVQLIGTEGVKYSHKDVYFYEEAFRNYSIDDLRRELIIIEQNISEMNKTGFWDKYLVPVLFLITTSIIGIMNALVVSDLSTEKYDVNYLMKYYFVLLFIIVIILLQIFLLKHFIFNPPQTKMVLQKLVINNILEKKIKRKHIMLKKFIKKTAKNNLKHI
jgi:hypothetical protein